MVALLRGVNVGGKSTLAMADLRRIAEGCGLTDVRTYIQSGNLVARSEDQDTVAVADQLRRGIAAATDLDPEVVVRTGRELAEVVDRNPFADRSPEPTQLHVVFRTDDVGAALDAVDLRSYAPEAAVADGRHVYLYLPNGIGRSRLAADLARRPGGGGTVRNWRTVTKLFGMVDDLG